MEETVAQTPKLAHLVGEVFVLDTSELACTKSVQVGIEQLTGYQIDIDVKIDLEAVFLQIVQDGEEDDKQLLIIVDDLLFADWVNIYRFVILNDCLSTGYGLLPVYPVLMAMDVPEGIDHEIPVVLIALHKGQDDVEIRSLHFCCSAGFGKLLLICLS